MVSKDSKKSLLVVDDEKDIADIICSELSSLDLNCFKANSMKEALAIFNGERLNAILTDVRMPYQTGIDLLEAVRELTTEIPVLLMTGYSDLRIPMAYNLGSEIMISKPFDLEELGPIVKYYTKPLLERWESKKFKADYKISDMSKVVLGRGGFLFKGAIDNIQRPKIGESKVIYFDKTDQTFSIVCRWHYGEMWGAEIMAWDDAMKNLTWPYSAEIPYIPFIPYK